MYAVTFFLQSPKERTCKNHFAFYCQLPISSKKTINCLNKLSIYSNKLFICLNKNTKNQISTRPLWGSVLSSYNFWKKRGIWHTVGTDVQFTEVHVVGGVKLNDDVSSRWQLIGGITPQVDSSTWQHDARILTTQRVGSQHWRRDQRRFVRQTNDEIVRSVGCIHRNTLSEWYYYTDCIMVKLKS